MRNAITILAEAVQAGKRREALVDDEEEPTHPAKQTDALRTLRTSILLAISSCRMAAREANDMLEGQIEQYQTTLENFRNGKIKPKKPSSTAKLIGIALTSALLCACQTTPPAQTQPANSTEGVNLIIKIIDHQNKEIFELRKKNRQLKEELNRRKSIKENSQ